MLDKCPVCGDGIVKKQVNKVLRGGNLTETVKIQAEVCLRCGERLYAPEVIKHCEKVRAKLEKMANSQTTSRKGLLCKLSYEHWILDFLEKRYDSPDKKVIEITSGKPSFTMCLDSGTTYVFPGPTFLNGIMPLTVIVSFKALDMIFEWILEENNKEVPKNLLGKLKRLEKESDLQLPPLFESQPYLYNYSKALFSQLRPYRNKVVHENSFSVRGNTLTLSSSEHGTSLTLSSKQVVCLVRFVCVLVRALSGEMVVSDYKNNMLRHYLDILAPVHGQPTFNQQEPCFVQVEFKVPRCGAGFPADLRQVRDTLKSEFPTQEVIFDLKVQAMEDENLIAEWYFAPEEVPDLDLMTLYEESHKKHRVAVV